MLTTFLFFFNQVPRQQGPRQERNHRSPDRSPRTLRPQVSFSPGPPLRSKHNARLTHGAQYSSDKFFWEGYTLHASLVASKQQHSDMLQFAALKGIKPTNQVYKLEGVETIETIFKKLSENSVRYRAVLEL